MILRPYQSDLIHSIRKSVASGARRPLVQAPTGSGKTLVMASIVQSAVAKGSRVLVLAPRRELIYQTSEKVTAMGVRHGVIMAGEPGSMSQQVQVACIPTLHRRGVQSQRMPLPPADVVLVDEAHLSITETTLALLNAYSQARIIGFTATPSRTDGKGLGELYDDLIIGPSVSELVELGHLVPARYFSGTKPDLSDLKTNEGDYVQKQLGARVDNTVLIGDIVTNWARLASDRATIVFAVNIAHSMHLRDRFLEHGIRAEHLDGGTPNEERAGILKRLRSGETQVLCNCEVLTYGWDEPSISCAVMARPTKSVARYLQMVGRVLRPFDDKHDALIIDHSGSVYELGFADDPQPWSLDGKERIQDRKAKQERKTPDPITCDDCGTTFRPAPKCPNCGKDHSERARKAIETTDEDLQELDRERNKLNRQLPAWKKGLFYGELLWIASERGYKSGWAANQYRKKFGVWPNAHKNQEPREPTMETRSWIKSQMIRYAKRKEKAA